MSAFDPCPLEPEPVIELGFCAYSEEHVEFHVPHPVNGRLVCLVCHPPAQYLRQL